MFDLIRTRARYVRLLDALGHTSTIDRDLRRELNATIDSLDIKIARLSEKTNRPDQPCALKYAAR